MQDNETVIQATLNEFTMYSYEVNHSFMYITLYFLFLLISLLKPAYKTVASDFTQKLENTDS